MKKVNNYYPKQGRVILHVDMNAFYCSVHEAEEPDLYKGKPIAVSGSTEMRKGIIVTSSYPARKRGIKTGMNVREALRICPELILIRPNFNLYRTYSLQFMDMARNYSPLVQVMSIDECFVDITGSKKFGTPLEIANTLQKRIQSELGLPCSIGIAPNKLLAKMASDMKKPNGITVLRLRDVPQILWGKPCVELYGIGEKTAKKLEKINIYTIGQLAVSNKDKLSRTFGIQGPLLIKAANGLDESPVNPERGQNKSVGHTTTLPFDYTKEEDIKRVFLNLADQVTRRLRKKELISNTVQITIRDPKMKTITRSSTLAQSTDQLETVFKEAFRLFQNHWKESAPVRLLGITLQNLSSKEESPQQLDLFEYDTAPTKEELIKTMDQIRNKYGEDSLLTAGMLGQDPSSAIRDHKHRGTSLQTDFLDASDHEQDDE
ncbi:DNA polymerase IV [Chengkuizengella axinellae]|uniref:DNA polymerase IV n=1 Tax=Chengkuizengella axinellae TaxID=3064388 RepID=A0ABT9IZ08_9BACL|nr:DNA polymerase IV [Chengkuizengella sp. 2205SS18-9]MDP5274557.1 DNA polymerase IV [Chengkuizengella sp. 2205SS18-9]